MSPEVLTRVDPVVTAPPTTAAEPAARRRPRHLWSRAGVYVLLALVAVPFLFPLYWMFVTALRPLGDVFANPPSLWPASPEWQNFATPFLTGPFLQQFLNSLYIAALCTLGVLAIASLAGYAFARIEFPGRDAIFVVLLAALLLPSEVTIIPLFRILKEFGWIDSHLSLIVPGIFGVPCVLGVFLMRQFFRAMPHELEQAARIDGLGRFGIFWRIALPLAKGPLAALSILTFLNSWNEFLEPLVFLPSRELWTLPVALQSFTDPYSGIPIYNVQMAATTLSVVPVLLVFLVAQRQFVQGIAGTGIK